MIKFRIYDKEKQAFWPESMTVEEIAKSHRFPSNLEKCYEFVPDVPQFEMKHLYNLYQFLKDEEHEGGLTLEVLEGTLKGVQIGENLQQAVFDAAWEWDVVPPNLDYEGEYGQPKEHSCEKQDVTLGEDEIEF